MYLLERDIEAIRTIIKALRVPRNKFGAPMNIDTRDMDALCTAYTIPHGGYDRFDKGCMLLQAIIGDKPVSILDDGTQP